MGIESVLFAALSGVKAISAMSEASKQAKAVKRNAEAQTEAMRVEGELAAKEKTKQIRQRAAQQTQAFLSSGITLEGTPEIVLNDTFTTGMEDLDNITKGYNTRIGNTISGANADIENIISSGRSGAIEGIMSSFGGADVGGSFGAMFDSGSFALRTGGQSLFDGGFSNILGASKGKFGPGF